MTNIIPFSLEQTYYIVFNHSWKKGFFHHEYDNYIPYEKMEEYYDSIDDSLKSSIHYKNNEKRSTSAFDLYFKATK